MKKLLRIFTSRTTWIVLGVLGLLLLIWFFGGLLAIGDFKPLGRSWVRATVCVIILVIWLGRIVWREFKQAKRNRVLLADIKAASQEPLLPQSENASNMSRQFSEVNDLLKKMKFSKDGQSIVSRAFNGQYLYQMPWYVLLGPAGS
ncbi:MAG: type VI secretion system membrane subunit TssM, partial [Neisseriaceae bacterium]|nr:type VI secretion system membrane subunit TssM [Neisseriaceae bacterium]